jgi:hypothetical protein
MLFPYAKASTFLFFSAMYGWRVELAWLGHLLGVLSAAKSLNEVRGQKVAGSNPVRLIPVRSNQKPERKTKSAAI